MSSSQNPEDSQESQHETLFEKNELKQPQPAARVTPDTVQSRASEEKEASEELEGVNKVNTKKYKSDLVDALHIIYGSIGSNCGRLVNHQTMIKLYPVSTIFETAYRRAAPLKIVTIDCVKKLQNVLTSSMCRGLQTMKSKNKQLTTEQTESHGITSEVRNFRNDKMSTVTPTVKGKGKACSHAQNMLDRKHTPQAPQESPVCFDLRFCLNKPLLQPKNYHIWVECITKLLNKHNSELYFTGKISGLHFEGCDFRGGAGEIFDAFVSNLSTMSSGCEEISLTGNNLFWGNEEVWYVPENKDLLDFPAHLVRKMDGSQVASVEQTYDMAPLQKKGRENDGCIGGENISTSYSQQLNTQQKQPSRTFRALFKSEHLRVALKRLVFKRFIQKSRPLPPKSVPPPVSPLPPHVLNPSTKSSTSTKSKLSSDEETSAVSARSGSSSSVDVIPIDHCESNATGVVYERPCVNIGSDFKKKYVRHGNMFEDYISQLKRPLNERDTLINKFEHQMQKRKSWQTTFQTYHHERLQQNEVQIFFSEDLGKLNMLQFLDLTNSISKTKQFRAVCSALPQLSKLQELKLCSNGINDSLIEPLCKIFVKLPFLHTLDLHGNSLGAPGAAILWACINEMRSLRALDLGENLITGKFTELISTPSIIRQSAEDLPFVHRSKLSYLSMRGNNLGDKAWKIIEELKPLQVEVLDLSSNNIGDEGGIFLAACLANLTGSLRRLSLASNFFGYEILPSQIRERCPGLDSEEAAQWRVQALAESKSGLDFPTTLFGIGRLQYMEELDIRCSAFPRCVVDVIRSTGAEMHSHIKILV